MSIVKINLNDYVWVKLTQFGIDHYNAKMQKLVDWANARSQVGFVKDIEDDDQRFHAAFRTPKTYTLDDFPKLPEPDEDGWTKLQLHQVLDNWGDMTWFGAPLARQPFEINIRIEIPNLFPPRAVVVAGDVIKSLKKLYQLYRNQFIGGGQIHPSPVISEHISQMFELGYKLEQALGPPKEKICPHHPEPVYIGDCPACAQNEIREERVEIERKMAELQDRCQHPVVTRKVEWQTIAPTGQQYICIHCSKGLTYDEVEQKGRKEW